ncbi:hypothetical protein EDB81DRAFT_764478 [Dactylonectria macrodidyma]|uniref:Dehydrogenase FUB6 n=1 Tax=Dactylonectria macrodidyma TaxID=307937 RepID=A0A9P9IQA1_9HYPO|nr:hypothetical protein EDB81DRAFT_764478 [Dactylonectria macrodidyma]
MATYQSVHLSKRPTGRVELGETFSTQIHRSPIAADLQDGEVILRVIYLSIDPAMRGWIDEERSYLPPVQIGEVMRGFGLGVVEESKSSLFPEGTYALAKTGWTEIIKLSESDLEEIDDQLTNSLTDWLDVLGFTGMTAYFGITDVGKVKEGDLVVVTGAAGATGLMAGQIAKIKGATVIGIAGSDEKCSWLVEDMGFDDALNYRAVDFERKLESATASLIDVFYDNVGGEILDMALLRAKPHARFVMCGAISQHNEKAYGLRNYLMVTRMRVTMQGFIIFDYSQRFPEARQQLSKWLSKGLIRRRPTILQGGISQAEVALLGLYEGLNTGKLLIEVDGGQRDQ